MERKKENRYQLGFKAATALLPAFYDMELVAEDLENMAVGQWCSVIKHYPFGTPSQKSRAETQRDVLSEVLGKRAKNYELKVEPGEKGRYTFIVERIR